MLGLCATVVKARRPNRDIATRLALEMSFYFLTTGNRELFPQHARMLRFSISIKWSQFECTGHN
jgi:hypothetical protein